MVEHEINIPDQPILAFEKVRHVGEGLAVIVAENRYIAEDAAELIEVDLEPLEPVAGIDAALQPDAARVHEELKSNVVATLRVVKGNPDEALRNAPRTLRHTFYNHRYLGLPMEMRGVLAEYDASKDSITVWSSTQVVHWVRREVAARLSLPPSRVRCIAPNVGGGFGVKGHVYPEDVLIAYLARLLGRPVRWVEDRQEHMLNTTHARDDRHDVEIGFDLDGRILALRDRFVKDSGAYTPVGIGAPSNTMTHTMGPYRIANFDAAATVVVTNKAPNAPYRGAGRPEAVFVMERLIDLVAHDLGLDPVEVRRRNMITAGEMPYSAGSHLSRRRARRVRRRRLPRRPGDGHRGPRRIREVSARIRGKHGRRAAISGSASDAMSKGPGPARLKGRPSGSSRPGRYLSQPAPAPRGRATRPSSPRSPPTNGASLPRM